MSNMQINLHQSEILMALRSILNCTNDEIIYKVTLLKNANRPVKPLEKGGIFFCPDCETVLSGSHYCSECGALIDWGE